MPSSTNVFTNQNIIIGLLAFLSVNAILNFQFNLNFFRNPPSITDVITDDKLKINILTFSSVFLSIKSN